MVTRLRWAAEKEFTDRDLFFGFIEVLKPVSGNTRTQLVVKGDASG
jgi:hypothetical protein